MSKILISKNSSKKLDAFTQDLPQSLILVGAIGTGKETILTNIAEKIIGNNWLLNTRIIEPLEDKKQISIDQIREIKASLKLSTYSIRIIIIPHAEKMTIEAQNSLLKMLEEPPAMTHFLLGCPNIRSLLNTIQSRSVTWLLVKPSSKEIENYYSDIDRNIIAKAIVVSDRKPGLLNSLINVGPEHELYNSIDTAREVLASDVFDRMCLVNNLVKDPRSLENLINALEIICKSALYNVISKGEEKSTKAWQKRLNLVEQSIAQLELNIQPKLVISKLFLML